MSVFNLNRSPLLKNHLTYRLTYVTDAKKRHKKDHDKTWKCEEKRGSKEHRKSKSSGGHRREWSPDGSNEGSTPLNLSDGKTTYQITSILTCIVTITSGLLMWSELSHLDFFSFQKN